MTVESMTEFRSFRLRTVWPFPDEAIAKFAKTVDHILVPELNLGQLSKEVERAAKSSARIVALGKIGGGRMIEPNELLQAMTKS
ncbi:MAG: hypothetical protein ACFFDM_01450, partial [Candidatus Thorarchaeota archaeon]